jgi:hypothetical protein
MLKIIASLLAASLMFAACSSDVSSNDLEEAKGTARSNAAFNAKMYRKENAPIVGDVDIVNNGDSSQTSKCPMGDGWATLKLVNPKGVITEIKCSTFSANTMCLTNQEFKTKPFAGEDGQCGKDRVPYPIPKLKE